MCSFSTLWSKNFHSQSHCGSESNIWSDTARGKTWLQLIASLNCWLPLHKELVCKITNCQSILLVCLATKACVTYLWLGESGKEILWSWLIIYKQSTDSDFWMFHRKKHNLSPTKCLWYIQPSNMFFMGNCHIKSGNTGNWNKKEVEMPVLSGALSLTYVQLQHIPLLPFRRPSTETPETLPVWLHW